MSGVRLLTTGRGVAYYDLVKAIFVLSQDFSLYRVE